MKFFKLLFVFVHLLFLVECYKHFKLGRAKGGNLGAPAGVVDVLPKAWWFKQKLDHFTPSDTRYWNQRYFVNSMYFDRKSGPVFLMIGGEGPADARWMVNGAWINYAKKFKALCFQLEHRYYGESRPTPDRSTKHLQYLSSSQALADLANFISVMNEQFELTSDTKWIVFGGSYPGSLAAWMRLKYPHLVYAAVSSSGPIQAKLNFEEYFQVVMNAIREKGGDHCARDMMLGFNQIETFIQFYPVAINKLLRLCQPLDVSDQVDVKNLVNTLADNLAELVQYNEDNRISNALRYKNLTITTFCQMLDKKSKLPAYDKLALLNSILLEKHGEDCLDYKYDNMISDLGDAAWGDDDARQWMYQTCTEFGFYQTSSGEVQSFGDYFEIDYFVGQCKRVFGPKYNSEFLRNAVDTTNVNYGGLNNPATRVIYIHGSIDPWHALGLNTTRSEDSPVIYIPGTAHCANMYPPSPKDPVELVAARVTIQNTLEKWLHLP